MIAQITNQKIAAYSLVALTVLIGVFNYWQGISIHDPDSRFIFSLFIIGYACLIAFGYRFARITIGAIFLFFAAINSLAILAYVRDFSLNSLLIVSITTALAIVGYSMLFWKGIRVFEEERESRIPAHS
jgi:hypothetical protein